MPSLGWSEQNQEPEMCALVMVCGLVLSTERSQREAALFSFFSPTSSLPPTLPLSFLLFFSLPTPSFSLSVDASWYR